MEVEPVLTGQGALRHGGHGKEEADEAEPELHFLGWGAASEGGSWDQEKLCVFVKIYGLWLFWERGPWEQ